MPQTADVLLEAVAVCTERPMDLSVGEHNNPQSTSTERTNNHENRYRVKDTTKGARAWRFRD